MQKLAASVHNKNQNFCLYQVTNIVTKLFAHKESQISYAIVIAQIINGCIQDVEPLQPEASLVIKVSLMLHPFGLYRVANRLACNTVK